MTTRRCTHCGQPFVPRPQVRNQAYCSDADCQRARKRQWEREKVRADPDYRANRRDAQRAWQQRHPDYWRQYRERHPQRGVSSAKTDACMLPKGLYQIRPIAPTLQGRRGFWLVVLTPVRGVCLCKVDACKDRT